MFYTGLKYLPIYFTLSAGVVSHLLLFICLLKDPLKCFRNSATYLIANLALSDFITCSVGLMRMTCKLSTTPTIFYVWNTAMLVSLLSIFSIAIDRYVLTVHPFKHRILLNGRRIAIWIVSIWLLSSSWLLVRGLSFGVSQTDMHIYDAIFIVIPLVTGLIYVLTYFSLRKQGQNISEQNRSRNRALQEQFLKTIIIVAFIQILTMVPLSIFTLVHGWSKSFSSVLKLVVYPMYVLNFAINPFLYIWRLRNYRQTFRLVFCTKLC